MDCSQALFGGNCRAAEGEAAALDILRQAIPQLGADGSLHGSGTAVSCIKVEEAGGGELTNKVVVGPVPGAFNKFNASQLPARVKTSTSTADATAVVGGQCSNQQGPVVDDPCRSILDSLGGSPLAAPEGYGHQRSQDAVPIKAEVAKEMKKTGPVGLEVRGNANHGPHPCCGSLYQDGPPGPLGAGMLTLGTSRLIHDPQRFHSRDAEATQGMPSFVGIPGSSGVITEGCCSMGGRCRGLESDCDAVMNAPPAGLSTLPQGAENERGATARQDPPTCVLGGCSHQASSQNLASLHHIVLAKPNRRKTLVEPRLAAIRSLMRRPSVRAVGARIGASPGILHGVEVYKRSTGLRKAFKSRMVCKGHKLTMGTFEDPLDAARAYDLVLLALHSSASIHKRLNFNRSQYSLSDIERMRGICRRYPYLPTQRVQRRGSTQRVSSILNTSKSNVRFRRKRLPRAFSHLSDRSITPECDSETFAGIEDGMADDWNMMVRELVDKPSVQAVCKRANEEQGGWYCAEQCGIQPQRFRARITYKGCSFHLGTFSTIQDAGKASDLAKLSFGLMNRFLNFEPGQYTKLDIARMQELMAMKMFSDGILEAAPCLQGALASKAEGKPEVLDKAHQSQLQQTLAHLLQLTPGRRQRYPARVSYKGQDLYLGVFESADDAQKVMDLARLGLGTRQSTFSFDKTQYQREDVAVMRDICASLLARRFKSVEAEGSVAGISNRQR
ncbi:unnamed protein product [Ostreobium quekettii]|uniref:AP2/ERF domain-containing protein n=1 Tax=Ostreobium quekettii TaxID=121088 RepID=A0A8S1IMS2_9CHLO|nr:unnamed protein product [Ostreobium quekettii]